MQMYFGKKRGKDRNTSVQSTTEDKTSETSKYKFASKKRRAGTAATTGCRDFPS